MWLARFTLSEVGGLKCYIIYIILYISGLYKVYHYRFSFMYSSNVFSITGGNLKDKSGALYAI